MGNEQYWFYVDHGMCPRCRKRKALPNRTMCGECLYKQNEAQIQRYRTMTEDDKKRINERLRIRYQQRKLAGICVTCGKKSAIPGEVSCFECKEKSRKIKEKSRRRKGALPKILFGDGYHCAICGADVENCKLCNECYLRSMRALEIAHEKVRTNRQNEKSEAKK